MPPHSPPWPPDSVHQPPYLVMSAPLQPPGTRHPSCPQVTPARRRPSWTTMDAGSFLICTKWSRCHLPYREGGCAGPNSPLPEMASQPNETQGPGRPKGGDSGTGNQLQGSDAVQGRNAPFFRHHAGFFSTTWSSILPSYTSFEGWGDLKQGHSVAEADPPASVSSVLGLQACTTRHYLKQTPPSFERHTRLGFEFSQ